jgi:hypothetical protein
LILLIAVCGCFCSSFAATAGQKQPERWSGQSGAGEGWQCARVRRGECQTQLFFVWLETGAQTARTSEPRLKGGHPTEAKWKTTRMQPL